MWSRIEFSGGLWLLEGQSQEAPEVELVVRGETGETAYPHFCLLTVSLLVSIQVFYFMDEPFLQGDCRIERTEGMLDERELPPTGADTSPGPDLPSNPFS